MHIIFPEDDLDSFPVRHSLQVQFWVFQVAVNVNFESTWGHQLGADHAAGEEHDAEEGHFVLFDPGVALLDWCWQPTHPSE